MIEGNGGQMNPSDASFGYAECAAVMAASVRARASEMTSCTISANHAATAVQSVKTEPKTQ